MLSPRCIQADAKAVQRIIERHLARKVLVERRSAQADPPRHLMQIEGSHALLAHDGSGCVENSRYHLLAIALTALSGRKHALAIHFCARHRALHLSPTIVRFT